MTEQLIEIDVRLLVLRYGRAKVLEALARMGDQTVEDLERQILLVQPKTKAKRSVKPFAEVLVSQCHDHPDIAEPLRLIGIAFENRTFLPHLRDVQRFLERVGASSAKFKSRAAAGPVLIRALAKLSPENLTELAAADKSVGESDYALLARAIMGPPSTKRRDHGEAGAKQDD